MASYQDKVEKELSDLKERFSQIAEEFDDQADELEDALLALSAYRFLAMLGWVAVLGLSVYIFFGPQ